MWTAEFLDNGGMHLRVKNTGISILGEIYKPGTKIHQFSTSKTHVFIKNKRPNQSLQIFYKTETTSVFGCTTFGFVTLLHPVWH